jgi:eukaryotic-like serine/threonine-protein kinase
VDGRPRLIADRYEVRPLERGGMGTVWQGYDTVLDRVVAIKQIRSEHHHSAALRRELADRFRREAKITAKIEHSGVPAVYDAAIDRDTDDAERLYLVMQLVRGVTVADLLARHCPLPIPWAVAIAAQVCAVLSYAHAVPVVHRDLKPSNVMLADDGTVKVLDFGLAAVLGTDLTRLTETGQMVGSRDYMAPEQFLGAGASPRSDLYAVGCLLHEMLAGSKVFDSNRDPALQHVHDRPPPLRSLRPSVDEQVERLVLDLLEKAPEERPASAQATFDRLAPLLPVPGESPSGPVGVPDPTRPYRHPLAPRRATPSPPSPPTNAALAVTDEEMERAERDAEVLIDRKWFAQAVDVLDEVIAAVKASGRMNDPRVLELRSTHAAALFLGGDFRRALTAFERLAADHAKVAGAGDERVLEYRKQVAYCHAELGDTDAALGASRALLDELTKNRDDRNPQALELRHQIGILLLAAHRLDESARVLRPLHWDLLAVNGAGDPSAHEVADLLARIEMMAG